MNRNIRVFVVDDSAIVRQSFKKIIDSSPNLDWHGSANDPLDSMEKLKKTGKPDVMILDIEMPHMNGIEYLEKFMKEDPIPTVICSSVAREGSHNAIRALELGALEVIAKPKIGVRDFISDSTQVFLEAIQAAVRSKVVSRKSDSHFSKVPEKPAEIPQSVSMIAIGSSTGGVGCLETILSGLEAPMPPILIVQHMPEEFTRKLAERLDTKSALRVCEAADGMSLEEATVYIAPGNLHMQVEAVHNRKRLTIKEGPKISGHKPSVDVLFRSLLDIAPAQSVAVLLTGMGRDGASGMSELKAKGAYTIAQDEESSTVYGMPKAAVECGGVTISMNPSKIHTFLKRVSEKH